MVVPPGIIFGDNLQKIRSFHQKEVLTEEVSPQKGCNTQGGGLPTEPASCRAAHTQGSTGARGRPSKQGPALFHKRTQGSNGQSLP